MKQQLIISIKMIGLMALLLGIIYPLFITAFAQIFYPAKANGSLIGENEIVKGSTLIGQKNDQDIYFNPRPSAVNYNTLPSGGSNWGLTSKQLHDSVEVRKTAFMNKNKLAKDVALPSDMLFASGSGIDPHISPQAALMQVNRIADARGFSNGQRKRLEDLVNKSIEKPQFSIFGNSRINVFVLNLELDKLK